MIDLEKMKALPTPQRLGRRIVAIRRMRGIGQKELAALCGISNSTLNKIENGNTDCRISIISKLEKVLQCTLVLIPNEDLI